MSSKKQCAKGVDTISYLSLEKSKIAGRGLIAKEFISKNTVITKYSKPNLVKIEDVPIHCRDYVLDSPPNIDKKLVVYGDPNEIDLNMCGYMANDKYNLIFEGNSSLQENIYKMNIYINLPEQTLIFCDQNYSMKTTKNIKKGEELTFKYGVEYWLSWNHRNNSQIFLRFMALYIMVFHEIYNIKNIEYEDALLSCGIKQSGPFMKYLGLSEVSSQEQWSYLENFCRNGGR